MTGHFELKYPSVVPIDQKPAEFQQKQQQHQQRTLYYPNRRTLCYRKNDNENRRLRKFTKNNLKANYIIELSEVT